MTSARLFRRLLWVTFALALFLPGVANAVTTSVDGPSADITAGPRIDVDVAPDGTAAIAYLKKVGGLDHVFVARKQGAGWTAPERVDSALPTASTAPAVAVANGGKVVVAFSNATKLYGAIATGGGAFAAASIIDGTGAWGPVELDLGVNGNGYLAALANIGNSDLYAFRLQGTTWTKVGGAFPADPLDAVPASAAGDGGQRGPRIAVTPDGATAYVVWTDDFVPAFRLVARRLTGTTVGDIGPAVIGSLVDGTLLGSAPATGGANDMGDVGVDAAGSAWIVYRQNFTYGALDKGRVLARSFNGTAFGPVNLIDGLPTPPPEAAEVPRIAVNAPGQGLSSNSRQLLFDVDSASLAAGVWAPGATINTTTNTTVSRSTPALADSGAGMVAYFSTPGGAAPNEVLARIRALDGTLAAPQALSDPSFGAADFSLPESGADAGTFAATAFTQGAGANVRVVAAVVPLPQPPPVPTPVTPSTQPPRDTTRPTITGLRIRPSSFRAGTSAVARISATRKAVKGATVSLTLSEAATVTFTAERLTTGRRVGGRCVRATSKNRRRARCTRAAPAGGSVSLALAAGANRVRFAGKLRRALAPGRYRLIATARDGAGNRSAAPARAAFTVLPPARKAKRR